MTKVKKKKHCWPTLNILQFHTSDFYQMLIFLKVFFPKLGVSKLVFCSG